MPDEKGVASPDEQAAAEQARFDRQVRHDRQMEAARVPLNGARTGWFHEMSPAAQQSALRAGYRPDGPAQVGRGELRQIVKIDPYSKRPVYEYEGDPEVWMSAFKTPVRQIAVHIRHPSESDEWFKRNSATKAAVWQGHFDAVMAARRAKK